MKKFILYFLLIISLMTFAFSGYKVSDYVLEVKGQQKLADEVVVEKGKEKGINFKKLKKKNENVVAWIKIPKTDINYPIVQTKDNNYYLNHDIDRKNSIYGAIFMDESEYGTDIATNRNTIIYGHNMGHWTSVMFGQLHKYEDNSFYEKSKKIYIYTENGNFEYRIISIMKINAGDLVYNVELNTDDEYIDEDYASWLNYCKDKSVIDCDEFDTENVSSAITLSTCMYSNDDQRFVVVAVR